MEPIQKPVDNLADTREGVTRCRIVWPDRATAERGRASSTTRFAASRSGAGGCSAPAPPGKSRVMERRQLALVLGRPFKCASPALGVASPGSSWFHAPRGSVNDDFRTPVDVLVGTVRTDQRSSNREGTFSMALLVLKVSVSFDGCLAPLRRERRQDRGGTFRVRDGCATIGDHDGVHGAPDVRPRRADRCHSLLGR